ncbi:hypothetical protein Tco_1385269 [Tanacetum coccineum]
MLCFPMWLQPVMSLLVVRMESLKRAHFALIASATLELESKVDVMIDPNAQNDYSTCATNRLRLLPDERALISDITALGAIFDTSSEPSTIGRACSTKGRIET